MSTSQPTTEAHVGGAAGAVGTPAGAAGGPAGTAGGPASAVGGPVGTAGGPASAVGGPVGTAGGPASAVGGPAGTAGGPASAVGGSAGAADGSTASAGGLPGPDALLRYLLRLGDTSLVLGQRLGEWVGHAPALEEDLGLANLALDLVGQARLILTYAAEVEGKGRDEDALAFFRDAPQFMNLTLAEQPNGDFAQTIVRQVLLDAWQLELYEGLMKSADTRLAAIAAKALKESRYHFRFSSGWLIRLGDGTEESHRRAQDAVDSLWRFTDELFTPDELDEQMAAAGIVPHLAELQPRWSAHIDEVFRDATLQRPASARYPWHGKRGVHTEHLGHMLTEMQHLQRTYPGAKW